MVEESQNGGRVSSDACLVGNRRERKYAAVRNAKKRATSVKNVTVIPRLLGGSSFPPRHGMSKT
jgi:hypothetical protein